MKYIFYIAMLLLLVLVSLDYYHHEIVPKAEAHDTTRILNQDDRDAHNRRHETIEVLRSIEKQNKDIIKLLKKIEANTRN